MKRNLLLVLLLACGSTLFAQTKFGIATYTIPAGWQSTQSKSTVVLEGKARKGGICKITLYNSESLVVNTIDSYQQHRNTKNAANTSYTTSLKQVSQKETADGITGFTSYGTRTVNGKEIRVCFCSFTNGSETFFVEMQSDGKDCSAELNQFMTTLLVDTAGGAPSGNTRAKKRKAAPASPAAPAPMM